MSQIPPEEGAGSASRSPSPKRAKNGSRRTKPAHLRMEHVGPIQLADVRFGDLTLVIGPQATGKSLFLQTLKLLVDRDHIHDMFMHHSMTFNNDPGAFLDGYFGRGMSGAWTATSSLEWNGKATTLPDLAKPSRGRDRHERVFYIPAQRVMSLPGGVSQNFGQFNYGDPYTLRVFSDAVHDLIQNEFGAKSELFPADNRLNPALRRPISDHLYGGNSLVLDKADFTKRLSLKVPGETKPLGFLSWSAGQREFTPMLLGLYWLCPAGKQRRKSGKTADQCVEWVVIEEPEMGLHPQGVTAVLLLVLELLRRGYRVALSTHSTVVLEMVWALQEFKKLGADDEDVCRLFNLQPGREMKALATEALSKDYKVYYFDRGHAVRDISALDPGALEPAESDWGGISSFASQTNAAVATAVNRAEARASKRRGRRKAVASGESSPQS